GLERPDVRADVFSLGCVLYECLTGEAAFSGRHMTAVLARILFDDPPRVRDKRPEAPAALDALGARMVGQRVGPRPRGGGAVAAALRGLGGEVHVVDPIAPAVESAAPRRATLTGSEQRAAAVIVLGPRPPVRGEATLDDATIDGLRREVTLHGGHLEVLID